MAEYKIDIYGEALKEFYEHQKPFYLKLHNSYGEPEKMPIEVFFREDHDLSELEHLALEKCEGSVLDVGAGTGVHSLILQDMEHDVTALDISPAAVEVMEMSGVNKVVREHILNYKGQKFDTILLLMNGIGLVGKIDQLDHYLSSMKELLNEDGQIIVDSSDISYLYDHQPEDQYYGEIQYQYEYKKSKGEPFDWLYVDKISLSECAQRVGLTSKVIYEDENDQYLAVLSLNS